MNTLIIIQNNSKPTPVIKYKIVGNGGLYKPTTEFTSIELAARQAIKSLDLDLDIPTIIETIHGYTTQGNLITTQVQTNLQDIVGIN